MLPPKSPSSTPDLPVATPGAESNPEGAQVLTLSRFRGDVARSLARRGRALLESDALATEVPQMPAVELYYVIKEVGVDEAAPLLLAATPEQFTALCDLDCWDRDNFVAEELDAWLAPLLAEGPDHLVGIFLALDEEVQVLFLQASLRVLDNREQDGMRRKTEDVPWPDDVPEDSPWKVTPEGFFTLIDTSQDREVPPLLLVDAIVAHDNHEAFRLLTAARWELESPLMEQGRHFRDGRMLDLGFCGANEAMRLFAAPPPLAAPTAGPQAAATAAKGPKVREATSYLGLPALYAAALSQSDCALVQGMAHVHDAHVLADLELQLVVLINAAVVGYGHAPKDVSRVAEVAHWVRDTLSLGLEVVARATHAGASAEGYAGCLQATPLLQLFQHGVAQVRPLQRRASRALLHEHVRAWLDGAPLDNDHDPEAQARAFLRALANLRPLWGGQVALHPKQLSAWQHPQDVAATQVQLDALLARLGVKEEH